MEYENVVIDGLNGVAHSHAQNDEKGQVSARIGAYGRISLDIAGEALGVARQHDDAQKLASLRGWTIVNTYTDNNVSAYKSNVVRPEFERMISDIKSGLIEGVVAYDLDRLWRKPTDLERIIELFQERPSLVFATVQGDIDLSTSDGRTMARIMVALANKSSSDTSRRVKRKIQEQAENGRPHWSRRPYGYNMDGTLHPEESEVIKWIGECFLKGYSYREITYQLNERGTRTATGKLFFTSAIKKFLHSERFAAIRKYEGQEYDGNWEPIWTRQQWIDIQAMLKRRSDPFKGKPQRKKYLLTGILHCACGGYLAGMTKRDGWGEKQVRTLRPTYQCPTSSTQERRIKTCASMCVDAFSLEHFIREAVIFRLDSDLFENEIARDDGSNEKLTALLATQDQMNARMDSLLPDFLDGTLSKDEYKRAVDLMRARLSGVEKEIDSLRVSRVKLDLAAGETLREAWMSRPDGWRRAIIEALISDVVISKSSHRPYYDADGKRTRFDVNRVAISWKH